MHADKKAANGFKNGLQQTQRQFEQQGAVEHNDDENDGRNKINHENLPVGHGAVFGRHDDIANQGHHHGGHGHKHAQPRRTFGCRKVFTFDFEQYITQGKQEHHRQERNGINAGQGFYVSTGEPKNGKVEQEEKDDDAVGSVPLVLFQEIIGHNTVQGHTFQQTGYTDIARKHGPRKHKEGIHRHDDGQPFAGRQVGHGAEQGFPVIFFYFVDMQNRQSQKGHGGIENTHHNPHIAQGFGKHAPLLFLDKVGRTLEARNTQHGSGKTEENGHPNPVFGFGVPVFQENIPPVPEHINGNRQNKHQHGGQVENENTDGHFGRFLNPHNGQTGKGSQ